jgi:hypothetical protein
MRDFASHHFDEPKPPFGDAPAAYFKHDAVVRSRGKVAVYHLLRVHRHLDIDFETLADPAFLRRRSVVTVELHSAQAHDIRCVRDIGRNGVGFSDPLNHNSSTRWKEEIGDNKKSLHPGLMWVKH